MSRALRFIVGLAGLAAFGGCGSRSQYWDSKVDTTQQAYGLASGVVLIDEPNHQVVVLTSAADHTLLPPQRLPLGHNFTSAVVTPDGTGLLLLSSGDWPLKTKKDDPPSLTFLQIACVPKPMDGQPCSGTFTATSQRYGMSEPLSNVVIDPLGSGTVSPIGIYAVAYQGPPQPGAPPVFATNPNEIVIFDLTKPPGPNNPRARTLTSTGGTPQRFTFSPTLNLPARAADANVTPSPRRLLVVENSFDVSLVDLNHAFDNDKTGQPAPRPDIIIPLSDGTSPTSLSPAGVAIDTNADDGRIALRTAEDRNIYTIQLVPAPPAPPPPAGSMMLPPPRNDFTPTINLTDVGGNPSDMAFVKTTEGLRVAALVPSSTHAVLVEPDTSATTPVQLASPYSKLSLVTGIVAGTGPALPTDVAMLWTASTSGALGSGTGVALWTLGNAVGQPYRSIDVLSVQDPIATVMDVPNSKLKILKSASGAHAFYVLDLLHRTPSPLNTTSTPNLSVAPDGERVWAYAGGGMDLAAIDLNVSTLNPIPLTTDAAIASVFDIAAPDGARSLVAIHAQGTFGATIFDARKPETATSQRNVALLLEAP